MLNEDWKKDPALRLVACKDLIELQDYLERMHRYLVSPEAHVTGYLYRKQIERNMKLRKELEECRQQMKSK